MRRYLWVIRYHSAILAPSPAPESARFGLCIDRHTKNRPLQDELVYNPISFMWARFGNMREFLVKANFFAVIMNPNTRVGAAGVTKPPFRVPMHSRRPPKRRIPTLEHRGHRKMRPEYAHFFSAREIAGILHIFSAAVFGLKKPPPHRPPPRNPGSPVQICLICGYFAPGHAGGTVARVFGTVA